MNKIEHTPALRKALTNFTKLRHVEEVLDRIVEMTARTTLRNRFQSGKFIYGFQFNALGHPVAVDGYNLLRHFGTAWSIGRLSAHYAAHVCHSVEWALKRYGISLVHRRLDSGLYTIASKGRIKTGVIGLALLATGVTSQHHNFDIVRNGMIEWILDPRRRAPDGDFVHKVTTDGEILDFRSDYYTGEILFGLIECGVVAEPLRLMRDLVGRGYGVKEQSHWMMYALAALVDRGYKDGWIVDYLSAIGTEIICNIKSVWARNQSCPTACRTEALCAFARAMLTINPDYAYRALEMASDCIAQQLKSFRDGYFYKDPSLIYTQIDYQQHNLTGIHEYVKMFRRINGNASQDESNVITVEKTETPYPRIPQVIGMDNDTPVVSGENPHVPAATADLPSA
jgi:hypothetical protein